MARGTTHRPRARPSVAAPLARCRTGDRYHGRRRARRSARCAPLVRNGGDGRQGALRSARGDRASGCLGLRVVGFGIGHRLLVARGLLLGARGAPRRGRLLVLAPRWLLVLLGLGPLVRPDLVVFSVVFMLVLVAISRCTWRVLRPPSCGRRSCRLPINSFAWVTTRRLSPTRPCTRRPERATSGADFTMRWTSPRPTRSSCRSYWAPRLPGSSGVVALTAQAGAARRVGCRRARLRCRAPRGLCRLGRRRLHAGTVVVAAFFAVMLPIAAIPVPHSSHRVPRWLPTTVLVLAALWAVAASTVARHPISRLQSQVVTDERAVYVNQTGNAHPVTTDDWSKTERVSRHDMRARCETKDAMCSSSTTVTRSPPLKG